MVELLDEIESRKADAIYPKIRRSVSFLMSKYDAVYKGLDKKGKPKQFYSNLKPVLEDGKTFRELVTRFGFEDE